MRQVFKKQFVVEQVVQMRAPGGDKSVAEYQTKGQGYPMSQNTWEPKEHLDACQHLIDLYSDYLKKIKSQGLKYKYQNGGFIYYKKQPLLNRTGTKDLSPTDEDPDLERLQEIPSDREQKHSPYLSQDLLNNFLDVHKEQNDLLAQSKATYEKCMKTVVCNQELLGDRQKDFCNKLVEIQRMHQEEMQQMVEKRVKRGGDRLGESVLESLTREGKCLYKVRWAQRQDGTRPEDSWLERDTVMQEHPEQLICFLEKGMAGESPSKKDSEQLREMLGQRRE